MKLLRHVHKTTPIFFLVEGESRQYTCEHRSRRFRIGSKRRGETFVICGEGYRHAIASAFYLDPPAVIVEQDFLWEMKPIAGVQLPLPFALPRKLSWRTWWPWS